jgi:membrane-bound lytic murein transglycosylase B
MRRYRLTPLLGLALAVCVVVLVPSACASRASTALTQPLAAQGKQRTWSRTLLDEEAEEEEVAEEQNMEMEDELDDAQVDDTVDEAEVRPQGPWCC